MKKILIVDDKASLTTLLNDYLRRQGFATAVARNIETVFGVGYRFRAGK